uniref:DUF305 domain-containing protein n=1 Tax=Nocardioides sp. TaxID=35761 RepID=UPI002B274D4C
MTRFSLPLTPRATSASRRRHVAVAGAVLALSVALTACGGNTDSDTAEPGAVQTAVDGSRFSQADVDFTTQMVPHHAQAVQMVVMAQGRDIDPDISALMDQIRTAQVPEIEQMSDLLRAWDEPIPETSLDHANAHSPMEDMDDMPGMSGMPGMMSAEAMTDLDTSDDRRFEQMWLTMMIAHHEGAIEMATIETESGVNE